MHRGGDGPGAGVPDRGGNPHQRSGGSAGGGPVPFPSAHRPVPNVTATTAGTPQRAQGWGGGKPCAAPSLPAALAAEGRGGRCAVFVDVGLRSVPRPGRRRRCLPGPAGFASVPVHRPVWGRSPFRSVEPARSVDRVGGAASSGADGAGGDGGLDGGGRGPASPGAEPAPG